MKSKIYTVPREELNDVLERTTRQYVVGHLANEQEIRHYEDENVEVGIMQFAEYNTELPHFHTRMTEYEYVIEGETKYMDLDTNEVFIFPKGSFYVIPPHTKYAQKSISGTKIIFYKFPGGNDKNVLPITEELREWYQCWEK